MLADVLKDASVFVWCSKVLEQGSGLQGQYLWDRPSSAFCQTQPIPAGSNGPAAGHSWTFRWSDAASVNKCLKKGGKKQPLWETGVVKTWEKQPCKYPDQRTRKIRICYSFWNRNPLQSIDHSNEGCFLVACGESTQGRFSGWNCSPGRETHAEEVCS